MRTPTSIFLFCLLTGQFLLSETYYVNNTHPSTSDNNPGTQALPWETVQHAVNQASPSDTIIVVSGSYGSVTMNRSGVAGNPIIVQGDSNGQTTLNDLEFNKGVSHTKWTGFTVSGFTVWGIFFRGENRHITLDNFLVEGGEAGIHLTWGVHAEPPYDGPVSDITIQNSEIRDCIYTAVDGTPGPCNNLTFSNLHIQGAGITSGGSWGSDGIAIEKGENILVEKCRIHDNGGDGIDLNSRDFDGNMSDIIVRQNRIYRNYRTGIKLWAGGRIENNVIWGQGNAAVFVGAFPGDYQLFHNTIAYNMWDAAFSIRNYSFVAAYPNDDTGISAAINLSMVNNIFAFNGSDNVGGPTGIYLGSGVNLEEASHNLYFSRDDGEIQAEFVSGNSWFSKEDIQNGLWQSASGQGINVVTDNPLFVSGWPEVDLHLTDTSPAKDSGKALPGVPLDLDGNPRSWGAASDIGAFEYQPSTSVDHLNRTDERPRSPLLKSAYPNPFNAMVTIPFHLQEIKKIRISVLDIFGRTVKCIYDAIPDRKKGVVHWDGYHRNGTTMPSGVYLIVLETQGRSVRMKCLMIK